MEATRMPVNQLLAMRKKAPENTYFDHLYSEFLTLEAQPAAGQRAPQVGPNVDNLIEKRNTGSLDWNDIYRFELILADLRPISTLRGKILSLRHDYLSIAGQSEYEEYMGSRPNARL